MSLHSILLRLLIALACFCSTLHAFQLPPSKTSIRSPLQSRTESTLFLSSEDQEGTNFLRRFTNPVLDDPFLPLTDVSIAQIVGPSLQIFWISLVHAPRPSWCQPYFTAQLLEERGSLVAPTLIHGAGLACCWLLGALAARMYERPNIDPTVDGYGRVFSGIVKAGAFASGVLILSTQFDLFTEYGRWVQPGESEEINLRLLTAWVEVLNDIIFEAGALTTMRMYLAVSTSMNRR